MVVGFLLYPRCLNGIFLHIFSHCSGGGVEATAKGYPLRAVSQDRNGVPRKCPVHHHTMRQSLDPTFIQNTPLQQASRMRGTRKQNIASWNGGVRTHIQNLPPHAHAQPSAEVRHDSACFCGVFSLSFPPGINSSDITVVTARYHSDGRGLG